MESGEVAGAIVAVVLVLAVAFYLHHEWEDNREFLTGPPTCEGNVTDVTITPGGFGHEDITKVTFDDNRSFNAFGSYPEIKVGHYYRFWVDEDYQIEQMKQGRGK